MITLTPPDSTAILSEVNTHTHTHARVKTEYKDEKNSPLLHHGIGGSSAGVSAASQQRLPRQQTAAAAGPVPAPVVEGRGASLAHSLTFD